MRAIHLPSFQSVLDRWEDLQERRDVQRAETMFVLSVRGSRGCWKRAELVVITQEEQLKYYWSGTERMLSVDSEDET